MSYVDGFVIAVPTANLDQYRKLATHACNVWIEHGALSYTEAVADDVPYGERTSFPRAVQATEDETVVFAWITYPSRERRDEINDKVMSDERMKSEAWQGVFDPQRMIFGGFKTFVEA